MSKKIIGVVGFIFALIMGQSVFADSWQCGEGLEKLTKTLSLDASQQAKVKAIKEQLKTNLKPNWEQMKALHDQVTQQVQSDNMDQSQLDSLVDKKAQLIGNMMKAKLAAQHQIYSLLTPQQKTKFQETQKKWEEKIAKKYEKCHDDDDNGND